MRFFPALLMLVLAGLLPSAAAAQEYDYCGRSPAKERVALVLDRSASYRPEDIDRLSRGLDVVRQEFMAKTKDREKFRGIYLEVRPVTSYTATSVPLFAECLPACPSNLSIWDECQEQKVARDQRGFWARLGQVFDPARLSMAQISQGETPLAEVIGKTVREVRPSTLIVFSDFLENHAAGNGLPRFSLYTANSTEMKGYLAALRKVNLIPDLRAVRVVGFGIGQEIGGASKLQKKQLDEARWRDIYRFWVSFFQEAGATGIVLERDYPLAAPPGVPPPPVPQDRKPLN